MQNQYSFEPEKKEVIAMAYVPWQKKFDLYDDLLDALLAGTIFPELDKPFIGRRKKHE